MNLVIKNGELIQSADANISVFHKGHFFNFAVYDSFKLVQGKSFFAEFHIDRLLESATLIGLEHPFKKKDIMDWVNQLISENNLKDCIIKFLLVGKGYGKEEPLLFIFPLGLTFYPDKNYRKGVKAITYRGERLFLNAKVKDLLLNFIAYRKANQNDALEALLIDPDGGIREGTRTNFYAIKDGKVYTAPLTDVLEGITRKVLLDLAYKEGIEVIEEKIMLEDLKNYQEFFITSTSMNVMPITQIDDWVIDSQTGPMTQKLIGLFKTNYKNNILNK